MADAYARISLKPGVVLGAQAGPGVANLVTGLAEAHLAYSPLIAIAGQITRADQGKDTFQEIDQYALLDPVCKRSYVVPAADRLLEIVHEAIRVAMSGRRGPVVIHIARDLFAESIELPRQKERAYSEAGAPSPKQLETLVTKLSQSRKPVIFAGAGIKWSRGSAALARLAEQANIPVVASTGHKDILASDHPLLAGQAGPRGNWVASRLTREADLIVALGTRLGFNSTFHSHDYVTEQGEIVQIDIEPSALGRYFPVSLGIVADAKATAECLAGAFAESSLNSDRWKDWVAEFHRDRAQLAAEREEEASNDAIPLSPPRVFGELRSALPKHSIVTLGTGAMCLQAADRLNHFEAPALITPLDFGLVGFSYAAAIGAAAAAPSRPVICIMGDGGFGYTLAEITTVVQQNLNVIAVVLDNGAWGAEKAYQRDFFDARYLGADLINPAYNKVAELCGAAGYAAERPGETETALKAALETGGPAVIHVKVDPDAMKSLRKDLFKKED